jgi:hypothetical protein
MKETLDKNQKAKAEEIKASISCEKNFECLNSNFSKISQAKDIGLDEYVKCLAEKPDKCNYSLTFGYSYLCRCPMRIFAAKSLGL